MTFEGVEIYPYAKHAVTSVIACQCLLLSAHGRRHCSRNDILGRPMRRTSYLAVSSRAAPKLVLHIRRGRGVADQ